MHSPQPGWARGGLRMGYLVAVFLALVPHQVNSQEGGSSPATTTQPAVVPLLMGANATPDGAAPGTRPLAAADRAALASPPVPAAQCASDHDEPKPAAPPQQFPPYPLGLGTLGYPPRPSVIADKDAPPTLNQFLTVKLRDAGTLRLYGFFRGDLDFATSRFNDLQNRFFVLPDDPRFRVGPGRVPNDPNNFNYSIYPRLTRAGLEYYGKPIEDLANALVGGRIEIDFQTLGFEQNSESRELLRLRLAYLTIRLDEWQLTVGQAWDVIAPLLPTINDNGLNWYVGNLGDRRPMAKLLWDHDLAEEWTLQWHQAISLGNAVAPLTDADQDGLRDQEATGIPAYQARLGVLAPSPVEGRTIIAGCWGEACMEKETAGPIGTMQRHRFPSYLIGADLRVPLFPWATFQGEAFIGRNLDDWRGGIAQGENLVTGQTILSRGFWAELVCRFVNWHQLSVGYSTDDPLNREVEPGGRTRNQMWYVGNRFPFGGGRLLFGLDCENWYTTYKGFHLGDATVVKSFAQLNF